MLLHHEAMFGNITTLTTTRMLGAKDVAIPADDMYATAPVSVCRTFRLVRCSLRWQMTLLKCSPVVSFGLWLRFASSKLMKPLEKAWLGTKPWDRTFGRWNLKLFGTTETGSEFPRRPFVQVDPCWHTSIIPCFIAASGLYSGTKAVSGR